MAQFGANKSGFFSTSSSGGGVPPPVVSLQTALNNGNVNILTWSLNEVLSDNNYPYIQFNPNAKSIKLSTGLNAYLPTNDEDYVNMVADADSSLISIHTGDSTPSVGTNLFISSSALQFVNVDNEYLYIQHGYDFNADYEYTLPYPLSGELSVQEIPYQGEIDLSANGTYTPSIFSNGCWTIFRGDGLTSTINLISDNIGEGYKLYFMNHADITSFPYTDVNLSTNTNIYGTTQLPQGLILIMKYGSDFYVNVLAEF
jgi:hypothetical protein